MKRHRFLILLVAVILLVGMIDYFLYLEVRRGRTRLQDPGKRGMPMGQWEDSGEDVKRPSSSRGANSSGHVPAKDERKFEPAAILSSTRTAEEIKEDYPADDPLKAKEATPIPTSEPDLDPLQETPAEQEPIVGDSEKETPRGEGLIVQRSVIALDVEDREPLGIGDQVSVDEKRIYCWVHVVNGEGGTITIRWRSQDDIISEADLPIGSDNWRTWSYITPKTSMIGPMKVEILREEKLLETLSFQIGS